MLSRSVLTSAAACLFALTAAAQTPPPPTPSSIQTRMSLQDFVAGPDGAKRIASLKRAVAVMKSLDNSAPESANFRRSWSYWANIHGYYGPDSPEGTVANQRIQLAAYLKSKSKSPAFIAEALAMYDGMNDQSLPPVDPKSPAHEIALAVWDTCQHSNADSTSTAETIGLNQANFFGWHRMYLYYFERVLRWAAKDPTLTLPYWDYTSPGQEALPPEFRALESPLFDARRAPTMNDASQQLDPVKTDIDLLLPNADFLAFEFKIERGIHGYVHCTVGLTCPVAHMGDVPVAGNDPIFYTHHANIDRIWACWEHLHPMPENQLWLQQQFMFPDETGALQKQPVANFVDTQKLGYQYENETDCFRTPPANTPHLVMASMPGMQTTTPHTEFPNLLATSKPVKLTANSTSIDITLPQPKPRSPRLLQGAAPGSTELVLRHLIADEPPLSLIDVYIAKKGLPAKRQYVGTINFFGAFGHHGMRMPSDQSYDFDVTAQLKALGLTSASAKSITVTLEASDGRVSTGKATNAATEPASLNSDANIRIGTIELRQTN